MCIVVKFVKEHIAEATEELRKVEMDRRRSTGVHSDATDIQTVSYTSRCGRRQRSGVLKCLCTNSARRRGEQSAVSEGARGAKVKATVIGHRSLASRPDPPSSSRNLHALVVSDMSDRRCWEYCQDKYNTSVSSSCRQLLVDKLAYSKTASTTTGKHKQELPEWC